MTQEIKAVLAEDERPLACALVVINIAEATCRYLITTNKGRVLTKLSGEPWIDISPTK